MVLVIVSDSQSRRLSFKAKRKGDVSLRKEANILRHTARYELKQFQENQLRKQLKERYIPGKDSTIFWNQTKRHFRSSSSLLRGLILPNGNITRDPRTMANAAADHYASLFKSPEVYRPHPYVDYSASQENDTTDPVPPVTYPEILKILTKRKKKRSCNVHDLSPFLLEQIPR